MKVTGIETLACDAGWRNYTSSSSPPTTASSAGANSTRASARPASAPAIERLAATRRRPGRVSDHERIYAELYCGDPAGRGRRGRRRRSARSRTRCSTPRPRRSACRVYALLGGKLRDRIPLYWSHCATWRINHPTYYKPAITDLDGVKAIGREVREKGFAALKTNIFIYEDGRPRG